MASNWSFCGACESFELSKPSVVYCSECEQGLCIACKIQHGAFGGTKSHHTTPIEKYQQLPIDILKISQTCPEHNERYQTYCGQHECACCLKCTLGKHKECKNMTPIDEVVGGVKASNVLAECETNLQENKENFEKLIKDQIQNLSDLQKQRNKIQAEIREARRKVNNHLDNVETQIIQKLSEYEETYTSKIKLLISSLQKKEKEIEQMRDSLSALKDHASDLQIFLSMKRTEQLLLVDNEFINKLSLNEELNRISFSMELDNTIKSIEMEIPTFGRVSVSSTPCDVVLGRRKDKQAQLHISSIMSVDSLKLDLIRPIDVKKFELYGCCFLPDGRFVVTSAKSKCIILMKNNNTVDYQIDVKPHRAIDVTHIPSTNTLAVTSGTDDTHFINVVNIETRKITHYIPTNTVNYGITYKDGDLLYCADSVGLCRMNIDSGEITTIKETPDTACMFSYITTYQDKLYFANRFNHTLFCCRIDGSIIWKFNKEILRCPVGICVDTQGYVYVVGDVSNNLIVISPDGVRYSELLTKTDGLIRPATVDFDWTANRVLVINENRKLFLYNVN